MPLTRKTRVLWRSTVLRIPSKLVEACDIGNGVELEIMPLGHGEFNIRMAKMPRLQKGVK